MGLTLAYAGSRGLNLMQNKEGNPTVPQGTPVIVNGQLTCQAIKPPPAFVANGPNCWTGTDPRTNPNWANVEFHSASGDSWYNSLQVGLLKRLGHGVQFQSSYTWSHMLDDTQGQFGTDDQDQGIVGDNPSNGKVDKGASQFDFRHSWHFN